ncbi:hypothetical protein D3C84_234230 [compost metagenome]
MQASRATFGNATAGKDPFTAGYLQPLTAAGVLEQGVQRRAQVLDLGQVRLLIVDDQFIAVRVGDGIAITIKQDDFGAGRYLVPGQGRRQLGQCQVGAHHGIGAAASGQGRADIVGRKENVWLGGDLLLGCVCTVEPGASAWVVGFLRVVPALDQGQ